jgi:hypothetical protein
MKIFYSDNYGVTPSPYNPDEQKEKAEMQEERHHRKHTTVLFDKFVANFPSFA